ncbi:MAG TPA: hypothetical protein VGH65_04875, partial [Verrucomicrobiaceae bacterium]
MLPYFSTKPVWLKLNDLIQSLRGRHLHVILPSGAIMHMMLKLGVYESRDGTSYASVILADQTLEPEGSNR